jgi:hypothetical protein
VQTAALSVKTVADSGLEQNGDFTLPGALCRAYDALGQSVATVVVGSEGTVRFDTLPPGVYRFVVTNQDAAVVLEVIGSASLNGPTLVDADTTTTAAVLVTLAVGKGNFDLKAYSHALAADLSELIGLVEEQIATPGDVWVTSDGRTVVDPAVKNAVEAAVQSLPGKGRLVRGDDSVPAQRAETTPSSGGSVALPSGPPTASPQTESESASSAANPTDTLESAPMPEEVSPEAGAQEPLIPPAAPNALPSPEPVPNEPGSEPAQPQTATEELN